ncbi:MAG: vitamin K epoxide reductase family protein [Muribaculaceae bacterium]|nr:vitamin K epoxide reductase family protein [Muribaculaceae bacterium]
MEGGDHTLLYDWLKCLGVKHTYNYTDSEFGKMAFHTLFGMKKLLEAYGVASAGLRLDDNAQLEKLPRPLIVQTVKGLVIVTDVTADTVSYLSQSVAETAPRDRFQQAMTGNVMVAFPTDESIEPEYHTHRFTDWANRAKTWVLAFGAVALFAYLFISNGLYAYISTILLTLINLAGIYITYLLVQKSAHIKNKHADAVCSVVEAGGCDDILSMSASKFFGIFGWSEVGFSYFSVSLLCLLVFPQYINYLAAINILCLPFSFWSVWYQRFRAKTWCTLCLCVQAMLWLLFFCYLGGGWIKNIFPLHIEFFVLGITYLTVMLGLNALMPLIDRNK